MPLFIVKNNLTLNTPVKLDKDDEHHLVKVMRAKTGAIIKLTDNNGHLVQARLTQTRPLEFEIIEKSNATPPKAITVYLPLIDKDRLEWAIEKLCELNMNTVQLIITDRTQQNDLSSAKMNRLKKIAISAQKQCERAFPMTILEPLNFSDITINKTGINIVGSVLKCSHAPDWNALQEKIINIFIGPEGGFTEPEIHFLEKNNVQQIHLGQTVLRTETAAVVLASLISFNK